MYNFYEREYSAYLRLTPVHKLPLYTDRHLTLPHTEAAAGAVLSLPIWPDMPEDVQDRVIAALHSASVVRVE